MTVAKAVPEPVAKTLGAAGAGGLIAKVYAVAELPTPLVARTVKLADPVEDGTPVTAPVDAFSESPAGREPAETA